MSLGAPSSSANGSPNVHHQGDQSQILLTDPRRIARTPLTDPRGLDRCRRAAYSAFNPQEPDLCARNTHNQNLANDMSSLFNEPAFSDCTIECHGLKIKAHKAILCTRSKFFSSAFQGGFEESHTSRVKFPEDPPAAVYSLVQYLYSGEYFQRDFALTFSPITALDPEETGQIRGSLYAGPLKYSELIALNLNRHLSVYAMAERLRIFHLSKLAVKRFELTLRYDALYTETHLEPGGVQLDVEILNRVYGGLGSLDADLKKALCEYVQEALKQPSRRDRMLKAIEGTPLITDLLKFTFRFDK